MEGDQRGDPESSESRRALNEEAKHAMKASAPSEDHLATSGAHPRVWLRNQDARELQIRCDNAMQALAVRLDAAIQHMPAMASRPSKFLLRSPEQVTTWARATRLPLEASWAVKFKLRPHERNRLGELRRGLAKSEVVGCAYDHILQWRPLSNSFTPGAQRVEPKSGLASQLLDDGFHLYHESVFLKAGEWILLPPQQQQQQQQQQWRQRQQHPHEPCMSVAPNEAQVDCLGSCAASLAFELIGLLLQNMVSVSLPLDSVLNRIYPTEDRQGVPPSDTLSSDTNSRQHSSRSRLARKAEQQQRAKEEELLQQAEAEWLEKSDRAQVCHAMLWRDLVAILFFLPECLKMDSCSPQTIWRVAESAHVSACVCQLLGSVFAWAENKEPLARKVLACPSTEELAGVLTMQISSMVRSCA
ncbi:hypothetical protein DUNSADRAFT_5599 [Dunaliella salina]|uniref:Uncharacterized protein n=1 Tax=Dunaliella salina TaxID=3046 RepID=A0ABQ7GPY3_DUNSA|nr:hypothetical protein DUNSADRAFT_5599 [Dunaliella salina]|eukprot:KAF5836673.1 hypothetical protein DUNSADRAFT_5599 [Dunaliella salina]